MSEEEEPLRPCEFENLSNEINRGKKLLGYFESLLLGPASQSVRVSGCGMASKVDCKVFKGPTNHHHHHPPAGQTGGVDRRAGSEKVPSLHINRMFFTLPTQRAIHSAAISSYSLDMKSELVARTRQFADPVLASWSNKFSPTTEANDKYKMTIMTESIQCGAHGKGGGTGTGTRP